MIPILEGIADRLVEEIGGFAERGEMLELKGTSIYDVHILHSD